MLRHGPWPPPARRDATNAVSGKPEAIALGERLFFEPRLSGTGSVLCATCPRPTAASRTLVRAPSASRRPSAIRRRCSTSASIRAGAGKAAPTRSGRKASGRRSSRAKCVLLLPRRQIHPRLCCGRLPEDVDLRPPCGRSEILADVGRALAAYQETLVMPPTSFDAFRDALARGDAAAMAAYPLAAQRGLLVFVVRAWTAATRADLLERRHRARLPRPRPAQRRAHGAVHARRPRGNPARSSPARFAAPQARGNQRPRRVSGILD